MRIKTKISKKDVKVRDYYPINDPVERKVYKYYCPICLRYFNTILVSSCCDNYICRFCIGDMARKAKNDTDFAITCSHCTTNDYKLNDVDPEAPLRVYTDTPFKFTDSHFHEQGETPGEFDVNIVLPGNSMDPKSSEKQHMIDTSMNGGVTGTTAQSVIKKREQFFTPDGKNLMSSVDDNVQTVQKDCNP